MSCCLRSHWIWSVSRLCQSHLQKARLALTSHLNSLFPPQHQKSLLLLLKKPKPEQQTQCLSAEIRLKSEQIRSYHNMANMCFLRQHGNMPERGKAELISLRVKAATLTHIERWFSADQKTPLYLYICRKCTGLQQPHDDYDTFNTGYQICSTLIRARKMTTEKRSAIEAGSSDKETSQVLTTTRCDPAGNRFIISTQLALRRDQRLPRRSPWEWPLNPSSPTAPSSLWGSEPSPETLEKPMLDTSQTYCRVSRHFFHTLIFASRAFMPNGMTQRFVTDKKNTITPTHADSV